MSSVKYNGAWLRIESIKVKIAGAWVDHSAIYGKTDGAWTLIDLSADPKEPAFSTWTIYAADPYAEVGQGQTKQQAYDVSLTPDTRGYVGFIHGQSGTIEDALLAANNDWDVVVNWGDVIWTLRTSFTWEAFADDPYAATIEETGISLDPTGKKYIGFAYNRPTALVDISDASIFTWLPLTNDSYYLTTDRQIFTFDGQGAPDPAGQTANLTLVAADNIGAVTWTTDPVIPITVDGTDDKKASIAVADLPDSKVVSVTATVGQKSDVLTLVGLESGSDALVGFLTNESHVIAADADGNITGSLALAGGSFRVFHGLTDVSNGCSFVVTTETGVDVSIAAGGAYTVNGMSADEGTATFTATYNGIELSKTYSISKAIRGTDGTNGVDGAAGVNGNDGVSIVWKGDFASHPASPQNGWAYRNTTDGKSYVYQDGTWYQMTVDGVDGANGTNGNDGLDIVWKGESSSPPASPVRNWAYRDTDNGKIYIYTGTAWELMVADGNDGTNGTNGTNGSNGSDGLSVFITYHDNPVGTTPPTPTGNGTTNGWHTNGTAAVNWMSQKVAASASSGTWGAPIQITGQDGANGSNGSNAPEKYSWMVYSDSKTTGTISTTDTSLRYIGVAHNKTSPTPDTTNHSLYVWYLALEVIDLSDNTILANTLNAAHIDVGNISIKDANWGNNVFISATGVPINGSNVYSHMAVNDSAGELSYNYYSYSKFGIAGHFESKDNKAIFAKNVSASQPAIYASSSEHYAMEAFSSSASKPALYVRNNNSMALQVNGRSRLENTVTVLNGLNVDSGTVNIGGSEVYYSGNKPLQLATARTISLGGDASGSATFDGSANATITTTNAMIDIIDSTSASTYSVLFHGNNRRLYQASGSKLRMQPSSGNLYSNGKVQASYIQSTGGAEFSSGITVYNSGNNNFYNASWMNNIYPRVNYGTSGCTLGNNNYRWQTTYCVHGYFTGTMNVGFLNETSDSRVKANQQPITNASDKIKKLTGKTYNRTDLQGKRSAGIIAQDLIGVFDEAVSIVDDGSQNKKYSASYSALVGLLVQGHKELLTRIEALEAEVTSLKNS